MKHNGVWDRVEPYLWVRRYHGQTGEWTRRFYVRFRDWKGKRRTFPSGTDLRTARSKKKFLLGENERRVDFDKGKGERLTFDRWADRYLELAAGKRTLTDDMRLLKPLRAEFGALPLEDISYARIKEFALKLREMPIRQRAAQHQSPATCNRKLALLRHILRMAWKEGLLEKLPAMELFPEDNGWERVLTEEEFMQLYEKAPSSLKPILVCAWETGMRRGEIVSLTWQQVNFKDNVITLDSQDTKTGRRRVIPISQRLREALLMIRQAQGKVRDIHLRVFLSTRGMLFARAAAIREAFDNAVTRATLHDVHFHDLRRSFVTRKVMEGWDRDYIKAITGHRTDKVFARYNKPSLETLRAVVEGAPRTAGITPVSHGPGQEKVTLLSA